MFNIIFLSSQIMSALPHPMRGFKCFNPHGNWCDSTGAKSMFIESFSGLNFCFVKSHWTPLIILKDIKVEPMNLDDQCFSTFSV